MIYLILVALATLIYAGAWMFAAPSKALTAVNRVSTEISRFDQTMVRVAVDPLPECAPTRVAFRFVGLGLILLSVIRLSQIA
jgi:hypothetical protein